MKKKILFGTIVIAFSCFLYGACLAQKNLADLSFMLGTWKIENKQTFETWNKVSETEFTGKSYKLINGEKKVTETLSIKIIDEKIIYEATVPNQNEGKTIPFELIKSDDHFISFENPEHDFPKKIQYKT